MPFKEIDRFWNRAKDGGRKSVRYEELNPKYFMALKNRCMVQYLDALQIDLQERD